MTPKGGSAKSNSGGCDACTCHPNWERLNAPNPALTTWLGDANLTYPSERLRWQQSLTFRNSDRHLLCASDQLWDVSPRCCRRVLQIPPAVALARSSWPCCWEHCSAENKWLQKYAFPHRIYRSIVTSSPVALRVEVLRWRLLVSLNHICGKPAAISWEKRLKRKGKWWLLESGFPGLEWGFDITVWSGCEEQEHSGRWRSHRNRRRLRVPGCAFSVHHLWKCSSCLKAGAPAW